MSDPHWAILPRVKEEDRRVRKTRWRLQGVSEASVSTKPHTDLVAMADHLLARPAPADLEDAYRRAARHFGDFLDGTPLSAVTPELFDAYSKHCANRSGRGRGGIFLKSVARRLVEGALGETFVPKGWKELAHSDYHRFVVVDGAPAHRDASHVDYEARGAALKGIPMDSTRTILCECPLGHRYELTAAQLNVDGRGCQECWPMMGHRPEQTTRFVQGVNDLVGLDTLDETVLCLCDGCDRETLVRQRELELGPGQTHMCDECTRSWIREQEPVDRLRLMLKAAGEGLSVMTPAQLDVLIVQDEVLSSSREVRWIVDDFCIARISAEDLEAFGSERLGLTDLLFRRRQRNPPSVPKGRQSASAVFKAAGVVETVGNREALNFLLDSFTDQLVIAAQMEPVEAMEVAYSYRHGNAFQRSVARRFFKEFHRARRYRVPDGFSLTRRGRLVEPTLLQRVTVDRLLSRRAYGNWAGTGAGKTLPALLASAGVGGTTLFLCPSSIVGSVRAAAQECFPAREVLAGLAGVTDEGLRVVGYGALQQQSSSDQIRELVERSDIHMIVIDEVHQVKQRERRLLSRRRMNVALLIAEVKRRRPDVVVHVMSATPVINELAEGWSIVSMLTGEVVPTTSRNPSPSEILQLHRKLGSLGLRYKPQYPGSLKLEFPPVDASCLTHRLGRAQGESPLAVEQILLGASLPAIVESAARGTVMYTYYVREIIEPLTRELRRAGFSVGHYTGSDKSGLAPFLAGDLDILLVSSTGGTGLDGLQHLSNRLVVVTLPWTYAEFEQLCGRLLRQGQATDVEVVIPAPFIRLDSGPWSYTEEKWRYIGVKKTLAEAVMDGCLPTEAIWSRDRVHRDLMRRLEGLHVAA